MKKFKYNESVAQQKEVLEYASQVEPSNYSVKSLEELSSIVNKYLPQHVTNEAPIMIQWKAARDNIDRLLQSHSSYSPWYYNRYVVGICCGLVVATIVVFVLQPWQNSIQGLHQAQTPPHQAQSSQPLQTPSSPNSTLNKSNNTESDKAAADF